MALVPQVVDAVSIPVIASGGIMDRRGVQAAYALGADAGRWAAPFSHRIALSRGYVGLTRSRADA